MDCLVLENLIFTRKTSPLPDDGSWRKEYVFLIDEAFRFCQCILDSCSCAGRRVLSAAHDPWRFFRTWMKGCRSFWANFAQKLFSGGGQLPLMHGLPLEALLLCWTSFLPGFTVIWLRLCDLLLPAWQAGCFAEFIRKNAAMQPHCLALGPAGAPHELSGVIDAGYKNAIPPAFCFLFRGLFFANAK